MQRLAVLFYSDGRVFFSSFLFLFQCVYDIIVFCAPSIGLCLSRSISKSPKFNLFEAPVFHLGKVNVIHMSVVL